MRLLATTPQSFSSRPLSRASRGCAARSWSSRALPTRPGPITPTASTRRRVPVLVRIIDGGGKGECWTSSGAQVITTTSPMEARLAGVSV